MVTLASAGPMLGFADQHLVDLVGARGRAVRLAVVAGGRGRGAGGGDLSADHIAAGEAHQERDHDADDILHLKCSSRERVRMLLWGRLCITRAPCAVSPPESGGSGTEPDTPRFDFRPRRKISRADRRFKPGAPAAPIRRTRTAPAGRPPRRRCRAPPAARARRARRCGPNRRRGRSRAGRGRRTCARARAAPRAPRRPKARSGTSTSIRQTRVTSPMVRFFSTSLAKVLSGTIIRFPSIKRITVKKRFMSSTVPRSARNSTSSPMRIGCEKAMITPATALPSMFCAAKTDHQPQDDRPPASWWRGPSIC